ncbi:Bacterial alpha-L-rhamnosidase [Candidatus Poribacteria bacterium]|nr:Bacterial alpha-L-rhamnosidase [Candidatus Poribacteria bacterium]
MISIKNLTCEYKVNPIGIDVAKPRLSWQISSDERNVFQCAYQVKVMEDKNFQESEGDLIWDSDKVDSDQSIHVEYNGPELQKCKRYYWKVKVWDEKENESEWSETAFWEMGLLEPDDWQAIWIHPNIAEDTSKSQPCPMLRNEFTLAGKVKQARVYATSLGLYEIEINGTRVGDQVLTPGWTSYKNHLQYQTYNVTSLLNSGENAVGVILGDGWYRGYIGFRDQRNFYGDKLGLLFQMLVVYEDGKTQIITSNKGWKSSTGPILASDIYNGEIYDARLEKDGWSQIDYDDSDWMEVETSEHSKEIITAPAGPPVRKIEEIKPVEKMQTPAGETVFDMGQNMVGWVRLKVNGEAGTKVILKHAEVLDQEGNFYTTNLRRAAQTIEYTLKGEGEEIFEPHFTFQGFRYVSVEGFPGEPDIDSIKGVVIHSDMTPTGEFECSHPLINQLQHNIVWGQKGNFVDVPTDCPQRDERLGWTGDAQVFVKTATFNMDVAGFFTKWLRDLAYDQSDDGGVPHIIPDVLGGANSAAWADASTIIPWTIYVQYGDKRLLEEQYPSMKAWVGYVQNQAGETHLWTSGGHFGDWLSYNPGDSGGSGAITDKDFIATAFYAYSTYLVLQAAKVLDKEGDVDKYSDLLKNIKSAFIDEFVTPNGRVGSNTQTAYVLALMFDLLPPNMRKQAAERLVADVQKRGNHLTTGFVGTPYLCHVLSSFGHLDVAYDLLNQETYPSWLYPVKKGATTIWERWDGIKPDGSFQDAGMNSFNHYAYGAIGEWLYGVVAGIKAVPEAPGFKHVLIQPQPGGGLSQARASMKTVYGEVSSEWNLDNGKFNISIVVPHNTTGTIRLPRAIMRKVKESGKSLSNVEGIYGIRQADNSVIIDLGSGEYNFVYEIA